MRTWPWDAAHTTSPAVTTSSTSQPAGVPAALDAGEERRRTCRRPSSMSSVIAWRMATQPVTEHHPVQVRVAEPEAPVAPPLRHEVRHGIVGDGRLVEHRAEAPEALAPDLGQHVVQPVEVRVQHLRRRAHLAWPAGGP